MGKVIQFPMKKRPEEAPSFQAFGLHLRAGDIPVAAAVLARLFGVSDARALVATKHLVQRLALDPTVMDLVRNTLRESVQGGTSNSALFLLAENFGLDGPESLHVLANLVLVFDKSGN